MMMMMVSSNVITELGAINIIAPPAIKGNVAS